MKNLLIGSLVLPFLCACTSVPQDLTIGIKSGVFYKRDMKIEADGIRASGAVVLPRKKKYEIKVEAKGKLDLFTFETCHRVDTTERAWTGLKKYKTRIIYEPNEGLEDTQYSCPVRLGGYEKKRGRHSWAFIDFQHPALKLPALVRCTGTNTNAIGVGVCQGKAGTIQVLSFDGPVLAGKSVKCGALGDDMATTFRFKIQKGECVYRFKELAAEGREFRFTTLGFEGILIRED